MYSEFFRALYLNEVRYLLCGGLAVNIYGVARMTADIDVLLDFDPENIRRFEECLKALQYTALLPMPLSQLANNEIRREMIKSRNLITYSYFNSSAGYMNIDVLIDVPLSFAELWENHLMRDMQDFRINVISLNDLISLKEYSNRIQDRTDIQLLSKLKDEQSQDPAEGGE